MTKTIELAPSKIRFMHDRIKDRFSNGTSLEETINKIELGLMSVQDLPTIRVVRKDGFYYAFDNRRLYVYRVLERRGKLGEIKVKLAPLSQYKPESFTTKNNGESIVLGRGRTLTHAHATSPPSSPETMSASDDDGYGYDLGFDSDDDLRLSDPSDDELCLGNEYDYSDEYHHDDFYSEYFADDSDDELY